MEIIRPLDIITQSKGKEILVEMKNGKQYKGKLVASDVHPNMVLEEVTELDTNKKLPWIFLRGDNISLIKPPE
ncbi:putative snRNP Sm-like protein [Nanobdella aerobiophila]|uniref:SnRNP Sm-like protein n=1 Tax=Nanobdella aerobiophila TaxID=2586965 RepID=A0A915SKN1_9ARCH|nr:LSM domain-containing protein [Nanobdella aerobiophila]BBL45451.1 putative snRNP Sm-like protein [Nanobdella aerobiophila]